MVDRHLYLHLSSRIWEGNLFMMHPILSSRSSGEPELGATAAGRIEVGANIADSELTFRLPQSSFLRHPPIMRFSLNLLVTTCTDSRANTTKERGKDQSRTFKSTI